ncbi:hypothetical protein ABZS81_24535 [Streptomyces sp. NPDC005318]|uniref:hypothetical protein n=1 Tax=Streptomyces sp. NPDC005318 TaxID=3157031 RepID=UPI00339FDCC0
MHLHTRRAVVSFFVSSLALSGAIAFAPTAGAVPTASCTVTPAANGMSVTITGEGFTAPRNLNDGESTERLNVDANGNFRLTRFQKNVDYTVLAVNEDQNFVFVNCQVAQTPPSGVPGIPPPGSLLPGFVPPGVPPGLPALPPGFVLPGITTQQ